MSDRRRSWAAAPALALALALGLSLLFQVPGCTAFKRRAYAGPDRDRWQQPERVIAALQLAPGDRVADLGAGGGYFTFRLADAVGSGGRVYAVDIDPDMLDYIAQRAKQEGRANVVTVVAAPGDPGLPETVDWIFTVDTYHHLQDRSAYFAGARRYLRPDGKVAVIDFDRNASLFTRWFGHYTAASTIADEMRAGGYTLLEQPDFLERQSFLIFAPQPGVEPAS